MKKWGWLGALLLAMAGLSMCAKAYAEDTPKETHYYRLDFVVKEIGPDGKVVNARNYKTAISTGSGLSPVAVRTGTKLPVQTADKDSVIQIQYIDVGVNIDCRDAKETPDGLALKVSAEISSLAGSGSPGVGGSPIIRQNKWETATVVAPGKPTTILSSDDLDSKGKMEVELTATQIH
ncbi:hypothetical protein [Silvibacterium sp.]|uniref:hypothetical protein n=1 Tax=Silvibacterium sp. TaxID=1964179 RepID=UPI0039E6159B